MKKGLNNAAMNNPLRAIPGFGQASIRDLNELGIFAVSDLMGKNPEDLYAQLEQKVGAHVDRCVLYGFREADYFAEGGSEPEKLEWWNWKDKDSTLRKSHACGIDR